MVILSVEVERAIIAAESLSRERTVFTKGDLPGHPFRGNQWSGMSVAVSRDGTGRVLIAGNVDKALTARAKKLRVPPAWSELRMSVDPGNELQATGKDAKGRMQYLYSAEHSAKAAAEKFGRVKALVKELPNIDKVLSRDAGKKDEAAVLLLMRKTGIRIGSERDTGAEKQAYGATTLTSKHVKINGDEVKLSFVGKKGVDIRQTLRDKELADALRPRVSRGGKLFDTDDGKVRDYLHANDGKFKAKDLRTVKALEVSLNTIKGMAEPRNAKGFVKARNAVGDAVSKVLGNTRSVALASYVPPEVFSGWRRKLGIKAAGAETSSLLDWAESVHYQMPDDKWDDEMSGDWWDVPETQADEDE